MKGRFVMYMLVVIIFSVFLSVSACSGNGAEELYKTAEFEELQNNREHALKLYYELIAKYPETEFARKAKSRVKEIGK